MGYLPRSARRRTDVRRVVPSARTVIVTGSTLQRRAALFHRAAATRAEDKWRVMRGATTITTCIGQRLERSVAWMREQHPEPFDARAYVDTGPVQERVYAQYAGLGWIGKNTCLINPDAGSWILLGAIICSLPLEPDAPALDQCGTCTLCLEACPTAAFVGPHVLDATTLPVLPHGRVSRLDSRWSIAGRIGNHLFGCDICQEVCPWNGAPVHTCRSRRGRRGTDLNLPSLIDLWERTRRRARRASSEHGR